MKLNFVDKEVSYEMNGLIISHADVFWYHQVLKKERFRVLTLFGSSAGKGQGKKGESHDFLVWLGLRHTSGQNYHIPVAKVSPGSDTTGMLMVNIF